MQPWPVTGLETFSSCLGQLLELLGEEPPVRGRPRQFRELASRSY
jgi:hypothetical protein